jgi:hypothetical protein
MLVEGEAGGEAVPPLAEGACVVNGKAIAFGHDIAMDSAHGVFLLAASFDLRWASNVALFSSVMVCVDARCRAALLRVLISSFCSSVKLLRLVLSSALLRALISSFFAQLSISFFELCHVHVWLDFYLLKCLELVAFDLQCLFDRCDPFCNDNKK